MIGIGLKYRMGIGSKIPILGEISVIDITDISAVISASIITNSYVSTVEIQYGPTSSLGSTLSPAGSPFAKSKDPVTFSVNLTGLLPYSWVFYRIVVTTSKGPVATPVYHFNTLQPLELADGLWVGMYDANYAKNPITSAPSPRSYTEIRDKQFDCALDVELIPDPELNSSAGWSGGHSTELIFHDGKVKFVGTTAQRNYFRLYPNAEIGRLHALEVKGIVQTAGGGFRIRLHYGTNISNGSSAATLITQNGDVYMEYYPEGATPTSYYSIINYSPYPTNLEFEYASLRVIKGNHFLNGILSSRRPRKPLETDDFIRFEGTANALFARYITNVGTCYGVVKRSGIDSDFVFVNDLTGIGARDATNDQLWIGREGSAGGFYGFDMKWINIRSVTDSPETIAKLNEWFSRESHELPPLARGILGSGIWNDAAIHDDTAIPVTI